MPYAIDKYEPVHKDLRLVKVDSNNCFDLADLSIKYDDWDDVEAPKSLVNNNSLWRLMIGKRYQKRGYGRKMVEFWEREMAAQGYSFVLTSTRSNEEGQFFYGKLGYTDRGALVLPDEPLEIIFYKKLSESNG